MSDNLPAWATTPLRNTKNKLCGFWMEGRCFKGKECLYAHGSTDYSENVPLCTIRNNPRCWRFPDLAERCRLRHLSIPEKNRLDVITWKTKHKDVLDIGFDTSKIMAYVPLILLFEKLGLPVCKDIIFKIVEKVILMMPIERYIRTQDPVLLGSRTVPLIMLGMKPIARSTRVLARKGDERFFPITKWITVYEAIDADRKYPTWRMISASRE